MFKINVDFNKHSFKEIKDFLTAGYLTDNCVHVCMSQQIEEQELVELKARVENSFFLKNSTKIHWVVFFLSLAMAVGVGYAQNVSLSELPLFSCIFFALFYLFALLVLGGIKFIAQVPYAEDILCFLKPLSDRPGLCSRCLEYCKESESASNYRNLVISSARQFRRFDHTRISLLHDYDRYKAQESAEENLCKALHGIS